MLWLSLIGCYRRSAVITAWLLSLFGEGFVQVPHVDTPAKYCTCTVYRRLAFFYQDFVQAPRLDVPAELMYLFRLSPFGGYRRFAVNTFWRWSPVGRLGEDL